MSTRFTVEIEAKKFRKILSAKTPKLPRSCPTSTDARWLIGDASPATDMELKNAPTWISGRGSQTRDMPYDTDIEALTSSRARICDTHE
jgi:hypothetical protein